MATGSASAADNPYQRGPDPTPASVAAVNGPFATASVSVPAGYGFDGGMIYYPTDTSQGTFGGDRDLARVHGTVLRPSWPGWGPGWHPTASS